MERIREIQKYNLAEILKDADALFYVVSGAVEGAMNKLEEYSMEKKTFQENSIKKNTGDAIKKVMEGFVDELPLKEKILAKAALSLPWSATTKMFYDALLELGKNENGAEKNTFDTVMNFLGKYLGG